MSLGTPTGYSARSYFFALVSEIQFELPSLKTHQHTAKFVPGDLAAVDNEKRHATIVIAIRLHHSLHDAMVRDVQSKLIVHEMLGGQGAAHLRDQSPKQHQQIVIWLADDLEMVASRRAIAKLEGVESYSRSEQVGAKVKLVDIPRAIGETHRFELGMFESLQPRCLGHLSVEALAAEPSVSTLP